MMHPSSPPLEIENFYKQEDLIPSPHVYDIFCSGELYSAREAAQSQAPCPRRRITVASIGMDRTEVSGEISKSFSYKAGL